MRESPPLCFSSSFTRLASLGGVRSDRLLSPSALPLFSSIPEPLLIDLQREQASIRNER